MASSGPHGEEPRSARRGRLKRFVLLPCLAAVVALSAAGSNSPRCATPEMTYFSILNPGGTPCRVKIKMFKDSGERKDAEVDVLPRSRATFDATEAAVGAPFATEVEADAPVVVERPSYGSFRDYIPYGDVEQGAGEPSTRWHFAEGYTGGGFETFIQVWNPSDTDACLTYTFIRRDVDRVFRTDEVPARSRRTLRINDVPGCENAELSTIVDSDIPVFARRSMYFGYRGAIPGGHSSPGVKETATHWFFSEGCTGTGFQTYISILNPSDEEVLTKTTFFSTRGMLGMLEKWLPPRQRYTVDANKLFRGRELSFVVESENDVPLVAERVEYFDYGGASHVTGGSCSSGTTKPCKTWYFAEGYTGRGFDEFLMIENSTSVPGLAEIQPITEHGPAPSHAVDLPPQARKTVKLNDLIEGEGFGLKVTSNVVITAERAVYFTLGGAVPGGTLSTGYSTALKYWYFTGDPVVP